MAKEEIFKNNLKLQLALHQIYRYHTQNLAKSEVVAELAAQAKENKRKDFVDL